MTHDVKDLAEWDRDCRESLMIVVLERIAEALEALRGLEEAKLRMKKGF